jgi:hypothetical protein
MDTRIDVTVCAESSTRLRIDCDPHGAVMCECGRCGAAAERLGWTVLTDGTWTRTVTDLLPTMAVKANSLLVVSMAIRQALPPLDLRGCRHVCIHTAASAVDQMQTLIAGDELLATFCYGVAEGVECFSQAPIGVQDEVPCASVVFLDRSGFGTGATGPLQCRLLPRTVRSRHYETVFAHGADAVHLGGDSVLQLVDELLDRIGDASARETNAPFASSGLTVVRLPASVARKGTLRHHWLLAHAKDGVIVDAPRGIAICFALPENPQVTAAHTVAAALLAASFWRQTGAEDLAHARPTAARLLYLTTRARTLVTAHSLTESRDTSASRQSTLSWLSSSETTAERLTRVLVRLTKAPLKPDGPPFVTLDEACDLLALRACSLLVTGASPSLRLESSVPAAPDPVANAASNPPNSARQEATLVGLVDCIRGKALACHRALSDARSAPGKVLDWTHTGPWRAAAVAVGHTDAAALAFASALQQSIDWMMYGGSPPAAAGTTSTGSRPHRHGLDLFRAVPHLFVDCEAHRSVTSPGLVQVDVGFRLAPFPPRPPGDSHALPPDMRAVDCVAVLVTSLHGPAQHNLSGANIAVTMRAWKLPVAHGAFFALPMREGMAGGAARLDAATDIDDDSAGLYEGQPDALQVSTLVAMSDVPPSAGQFAVFAVDPLGAAPFMRADPPAVIAGVDGSGGSSVIVAKALVEKLLALQSNAVSLLATRALSMLFTDERREGPEAYETQGHEAVPVPRRAAAAAASAGNEGADDAWEWCVNARARRECDRLATAGFSKDSITGDDVVVYSASRSLRQLATSAVPASPIGLL